MSLPQEACALIHSFGELVSGVPASEATLKEILAYFWQPRHLYFETEPDLRVEIEGHKHYKRKRGGETELVEELVTLYVHHLQDPIGPGNYRPRRVLFRGAVTSADDTEGFLKHLTKCRRIVRVVRAGGLCACGRLKLTNARLCAECAIREFLQ